MGKSTFFYIYKDKYKNSQEQILSSIALYLYIIYEVYIYILHLVNQNIFSHKSKNEQIKDLYIY